MSIPSSVINHEIALPNEARVALIAKRCLDLALSLPAALLLTPFFTVIAIVIKLDSPGAVFFRQVRVGRGGKHFRIFKFRTMVANAESKGAAITIGQDRRITRSGRWLRALKLDELPQLFNVVTGEMSLVGPRPEVPHYVAQYDETQRQILALTPGITSMASLQFRDESSLLAQQTNPEQFYFTHLMPEKIRLDLDYARQANLLSDLGVICKTVLCLVRR